MLLGALLVVGVLTRPGRGHALRGVAYDPGGCLVTSQVDNVVNVTCHCGQTLLQTAGTSPAIDRLTVFGCATEPSVTRVSFASDPDTRQPVRRDILLLNARSVHLTGGAFSLLAGAGGQTWTANPLQELVIEDVWLGDDAYDGLAAGSLQGLPELQHVLLLRVNMTALFSGSLADLPRLQTLEMAHCHVGTVEEYAIARTPGLRHLHITHTEFQSVESRAIVVEALDDDEVSCARRVSAGDSADDVSFLIAHCMFTTLAPGAIRFGGVQRLILDDNAIHELRKASLNVSTQARCGRAARLQLTNNVASVIVDAPNVIVVNDGAIVAPFLHGGNELEPQRRERTKQAARFPPPHLKLAGRFRMSRVQAPPTEFWEDTDAV